MKKHTIPGTSEFCVGVNYWASHAGTGMWHNFSAEEVEKDFSALKNNGINTVRLFPLWSDFQPVVAIAGCFNGLREFGFADGSPLPATGIASFGLSQEMMKKFRLVADLALKYDLKLVVALLTGWMSGAAFVPPILSGKNLIEDPLALRISEMFLRGFVNDMKDHPAIVAWEPGNECNCLSSSSADSSWNWLHMVCSTIRLADPERPVYAGIHGCGISARRPFNQNILGELCDALTTHPYPAFTPHCGRSALNTIPAVYHATAETLYYRGCSGKPAFIEEIGAFGEGYLSEQRTDAYLYTTLYSALIHGLGGVLWWCGFSFDRCAGEEPYRWGAMERNLGAFKSDRTPDGAAKAMKRFRKELAELPEIPPREIDAVVVLSWLDDAWKTAYGAFILSKQAGFEIEFCNIAAVDTLPESKFYIVPSISGYDVMEFSKYNQLLEAARNGATVVFTADSGILYPFSDLFGVEVDYRTEEPDVVTFDLAGSSFSVKQSITRKLNRVSCQVLAADAEDRPVITCSSYGKGKLVFVNAALENNALTGSSLHIVYRYLASLAGLSLPEKSQEIGITRHKLPDGRTLTFYINYSDSEADGLAGNSVKYEIR